MTGRARRVLLSAGILAAGVLSLPGAAFAQIQQSDVDSQPATTQTTQLVTSSTEVRRAVIGLLFVAAVGLIVFVLYWMLTGRAARQRFESEFGGRHVAEPESRRARRRRHTDTAPTQAAAAPVRRPPTAGAPGRDSQHVPERARRARPTEPVVRPGEVHPGWLDPTGSRRRPGTVHPAWADNAGPRTVNAPLPERRAAALETDRGISAPSWNEPPDGAWPRPFEGR